jgi:threonine/homoserine/homoserine lactone efflux protein
MSVELYTAYLVACLVIAIVPGPIATVIIANSLSVRPERSCAV